MRTSRLIHAVLTAVLATSAAPLLTSPVAQADGTVTLTDDSVALGKALAGDINWVTGAQFDARPGPTTALVSGNITGMPTSGASAVLLSTGDATLITAPNDSGSAGSDLGGPAVRGNSDYDVTVLRIDLQVPATANCLVGLDFRFLSEEYPEYVGTRYNDAFVAELDESTWTTSGSTISAPNNFAFDPSGSPITINASGVTSMSAEQAAGTTFDGATPLLTAATPLTPGPHSLYLSIFDQGDRIYDSAVIVDNLRLGSVGNVATDCRPGARVIDKSSYVALGDSYSSGFGVSPYFAGTNEDGTPNNCQRSTRAYSTLVAAGKALDLDFHACQGAVTKDFYEPRNSTWGEPAQLDWLTGTTGLVTLSVGGNDANFAGIVKDCIDGAELLPFNTCYNDANVEQEVRERMARLDNRAQTPAEVVPYQRLYSSLRNKAASATLVAVGYPHFYTASGSDRTFLPGGRCEGVKKADQRWMVEKIDELNRIIERNARRAGMVFANPNPRFDGHELCSGGTEWIYGLLSAGRFHPNASGQSAIAQAVIAALDNDGFQRFTIQQDETVAYSFVVGSGQQFISLNTGWPGSDIALTLVSPSGRQIDRAATATDVIRDTGPTYEHVEVANPEPGTWTAELHGVEVSPGGEPVTLSVYASKPANQSPMATFETRIDGNELVLDASASTDPDGTITGYDWYISTAETDTVLQGQEIRVPLRAGTERTFTLVVTDNRSGTSFAEVRFPLVDIMPGSDVNPIKMKSQGLTPIAILSSATFDATTVDPATVMVGPGDARPVDQGPKLEDINGDGFNDQLFHFRTQDLGLTSEANQLCVTGMLADTESFSSCDRVRPQ